MSEEILDYKKSKNKSSKVLKAVFILAMILFVYWFGAGYLGWPYGGLALFTGLAMLSLVTIIRFFLQRRRKLFSWFYFLGKLTLIAAIFLSLMHYSFANYFIWGAFVFFAAGVATLYLGKPKG